MFLFAFLMRKIARKILCKEKEQLEINYNLKKIYFSSRILVHSKSSDERLVFLFAFLMRKIARKLLCKEKEQLEI